MQLRDVVVESDGLAARLALLEADRDVCSRRAAHADARSEHLAAQLSTAVARGDSLATQVSAATADTATVVGQLEEAVAECDALRARVSQLTAEGEGLRADKQHAAEAEAAWIAEARRAQSDADAARRGVEEAEADCGAAQRRMEEMEEHLTVLDGEVHVYYRHSTIGKQQQPARSGRPCKQLLLIPPVMLTSTHPSPHILHWQCSCQKHANKRASMAPQRRSVLAELRVATDQVTQAAERCCAMSQQLAAVHAERGALRIGNAALNADKERLLELGQHAAAALEECRREAELAARIMHAEQVSVCSIAGDVT